MLREGLHTHTTHTHDNTEFQYKMKQKSHRSATISLRQGYPYLKMTWNQSRKQDCGIAVTVPGHTGKVKVKTVKLYFGSKIEGIKAI